MIPGGLILAGGRGERLGGQDKGLLLHDGEPYVAHLARCLGPVTSAVAISANDHDADYRHWANTVLADRHFAGQGPLAGLYEGLSWAQTQSLPGLLVVTCDTPALPPAWAVQMLEAARLNPETPCLSETPDQRHYLHGYYPVSVLPTLHDALTAGENRAWRLAERTQALWLDCEAMASGFININTKADQKELAGR